LQHFWKFCLPSENILKNGSKLKTTSGLMNLYNTSMRLLLINKVLNYIITPLTSTEAKSDGLSSVASKRNFFPIYFSLPGLVIFE